jgi:hypothetical protein
MNSCCAWSLCVVLTRALQEADAAAATASAADTVDALERYEGDSVRAEHARVAARLRALLADLGAALDKTSALARVAAPAHVDAVRDVDVRVRLEALWLHDADVRAFMRRVDDACEPIRRKRPRRATPQLKRQGSVLVQANALPSLTAAQIQADELAAEQRAGEIAAANAVVLEARARRIAEKQAATAKSAIIDMPGGLNMGISKPRENSLAAALGAAVKPPLGQPGNAVATTTETVASDSTTSSSSTAATTTVPAVATPIAAVVPAKRKIGPRLEDNVRVPTAALRPTPVEVTAKYDDEDAWVVPPTSSFQKL